MGGSATKKIMNEDQYPISWRRKINPLFWLGNFNDPVNGLRPDGTVKHADFHPNKPLWQRKFLWFCRNPFHNLFFFVIGLHDRVEQINPGEIWPKEGQKWNIILPFISYRGKKYIAYLGWRKGIDLGAKINKKR